jgi:GDPmannose 4,6-dehydratase
VTRTALVLGVTGQDGVLLARHLRSADYRVVGTTRPGLVSPLAVYLGGVEQAEHDVRDTEGFDRLLVRHQPDEVYNLAGFTSVGASWEQPDLVQEVNATAVEAMLDSLVRHRQDTGQDTRFLQASSSEIFGHEVANPQVETTPHSPSNPYGESKSRAHRATQERREHDGLFASVAVLYNHESPVRGRQFVTRKIVRAAVEISEDRAKTVTLGNLEVSRDWGAARDYVVAMHAALTQEEPDDFVLATGVLHSLEDLLTTAFARVGITDPWPYVRTDPALVRSADAPGLTGDSSHARARLGWTPRTTFAEMVAEMVDVDLRRVRSGVEESADYLLA